MTQILFLERLEARIGKIPGFKPRRGCASNDRSWPVSLYSTARQQENSEERNDFFSYRIHRAFLHPKKNQEIQPSEKSVMPVI